MDTRRFGKRIPLPSTRAIKHQYYLLVGQEQVAELNLKVSEAIYAAEHVADQNSQEARAAYASVSLLEEKIAGLTPATSTEGLLARRGAIRAAVNSGNTERADFLVALFTLESDDPSHQEGYRAFLSK